MQNRLHSQTQTSNNKDPDKNRGLKWALFINVKPYDKGFYIH